MEKTIEQWLKENLTPEQFENAKKCKAISWDFEVCSLMRAISIGFEWNKMPEGWDYWGEQHDNLKVIIIQKTIEQWLKEGLTPEQFENAKNNKFRLWENKVDLLSDAISFGFHWDGMPEGYYYWHNKWQDLYSKGL